MPSALESINEQQYIHMVEAVFDTVEQMYLRNDENKVREKLMNELRKHLQSGGKVSYALVQQQFSHAIRNALEEQVIPYTCVPDAMGNMLFLTRDQDADKLMEIQKTYILTSTDYAKELTPQRMINLYSKLDMRSADVLTFSDREMAMIAEQKLFRAGITFARTENEDSSTSMIISPFSLYSPKGEDLSNFELLHAFEQSKADEMFEDIDLLKLRFEQAKHDNKQLEDFAKKIKNGESCVLAPAYGQVNAYIESSAVGTYLFERAGNEWKSHIIQIDPDADIVSIKAAISKPADKIDDANSLYKGSFDRNNNCKDIEEAREKGRSIRPLGNAKTKHIDSIANNEVKPMLDAINREATRQLNALISSKYMPDSEAYESKKKIITSILTKKELPEIRDFLENGTAVLDREKRLKWYSNIEDHFNNTHEKSRYECRMDRTSLKNLAQQIEISRGAAMSQEKGMEQDGLFDIGSNM